MPYFLIKNIPVFLPKSRYNYLFNEVLKNKTPLERTSAMIASHKESLEAMDLMYQKLLSEFTVDKNKFISDWVHFDLQNDEASENVWDLLYDYCNYYGFAYLRDIRGFSDRLMDDVKGFSFKFPMGDIFELFIPFKYKKDKTKIISLFCFSKRSGVVILINKNEVYRLIGHLTKFTIIANNFILKCDDEIRIIPIEKKSAKRHALTRKVRNEKRDDIEP